MNRLLTVLLAATALTVCGMGESSVAAAKEVEREAPAGAPVAETVRGLTAFGHNLLTTTAKPGANAVLSPLSIGYAYGMARSGAAGRTGPELDRVFGFPSGGPHTSFNTLTRRIVTLDGPPPAPAPGATRDARSGGPARPLVGLANGLFTQEGLSVEPKFLRTLAAQYGTGVREVDFTGNALDVINAWAREQTAGRVKKVFDRLDPRIKLVIANAVYFKAEWATAFTDPPEKNAAFTRADGTTVRTTLMRQTGSFSYAVRPGWQAVELPYAKSDLVMWVLLPRAGGSPARLLAPPVMAQVATALKKTPVKIAMPRWDFATNLSLHKPLKKLGLADSDYSGIAPGVSLGEAVHRATISVDEWGTEAAAVTGLAFPKSAMIPPGTEVRADHPFAFAIVHRPTLTPLFIGQVADPTAKG
ncbi:serpin family protein [Streptosporangium sp. NPDC000396]|uniref:serpin family protein n=1 Tax=Streptosporangium sp. NPDC000396 TaxID=3366185 RepID=UPI0036A763EE